MTTIEVAAGDEARPVGQAHVTRHRGHVSTTFLYDPRWLGADGVAIDPAMPLVAGAQHRQGLVRAFADSAPDRWGRNLIEKAERLRAREQGLTPRRLDDLDFLLGVSDDTRQGALRFRVTGESEFAGKPSRVPQLVALPELLRAADEVESGDDPASAIKQLLDTGTTGLGGARPKASVRLEDGSLALAKFPHASDRWDVMAWEMIALDLLESIGVRTPQRRLTHVGERSVLILRRFDRTESGARIGYISAMTAIGARDGDARDYVDIADAVRDLSRSPRADHQELFTRAVANVAIGNTDDHLRNHGFVSAGRLWALSPAFDVNPNPDPTRARSTAIMGADSLPDEVNGLVAFAEECGLGAAAGRERMREIAAGLGNWRSVAERNGIRQSEISLMAESIAPRLEAIAAA